MHLSKDEARVSVTQGPRRGRKSMASRKKAENDADLSVTLRLRAAGLRPTRQRTALAGLLFRGGDKHVSAEDLHEEAIRAGFKVSLATVYNTLHQFTDAGLLQKVVVEASRCYFDTNMRDHQHFYCPGDDSLVDIPGGEIKVSGWPAAPKGMKVERVDVIVRLKRG